MEHFENTSVPNVAGTSPSKRAETRFKQPLNALLPIDITLDGIDTEVRPVQPSNAPAPMFVMPYGIKTLVMPVFAENAPAAIVFTNLPSKENGI